MGAEVDLLRGKAGCPVSIPGKPHPWLGSLFSFFLNFFFLLESSITLTALMPLRHEVFTFVCCTHSSYRQLYFSVGSVREADKMHFKSYLRFVWQFFIHAHIHCVTLILTTTLWRRDLRLEEDKWLAWSQNPRPWTWVFCFFITHPAPSISHLQQVSVLFSFPSTGKEMTIMSIAKDHLWSSHCQVNRLMPRSLSLSAFARNSPNTLVCSPFTPLWHSITLQLKQL